MEGGDGGGGRWQDAWYMRGGRRQCTQLDGSGAHAGGGKGGGEGRVRGVGRWQDAWYMRGSRGQCAQLDQDGAYAGGGEGGGGGGR
jgi:hypothetical protein